MAEREPKSRKKIERRARALERHDSAQHKSLLQKSKEVGLATRLALSALALGGMAAAYQAYEQFIKPTPEVLTYDLNYVRTRLEALERDAKSGQFSSFQIASSVGNLAFDYLCQELNPQISCQPEVLKSRVNILSAKEFNQAATNTIQCSDDPPEIKGPAFTNSISQKMYFDIDQLVRLPISVAWQAFLHEGLHTSESNQSNIPREIYYAGKNQVILVTKQFGFSLEYPDSKYNMGSNQCYRSYGNWLEEAAIVDAAGRIINKVGLQQADSIKYLTVARNYKISVVDALFGGDYKTAFKYRQQSDAIAFYQEVGRRVLQKSQNAQALSELDFQKAAAIYLEQHILENPNK